ncbi:MAG: AAA family ATPase [Patescibacteria group bacterium]
MYLKSLTLSGFKSFGKTTVFEFPSSVTAVVGPNGSGKSNVAEALRWVLGEQSMKTLRGKKGEDLIFNGSDHASRMSRAEVKLVFDNSKKQFPFEFEDVVVARRVMRDGSNEYLLNGSVVRLKDIFELLSRVGLGATQHHIISQGEVDRILWASLADRQEMIEEALGLKEFHLKQREAERKLTETESNMKQVEAARREIQPHLKFLSTQAEKMRAHEHFARELGERLGIYAAREKTTLDGFDREYQIKKSPIEKEKKEKESEINEIQKEIHNAEKRFSITKKGVEFNTEIEELELKRRAFERELGKLEGMLAGAAAKPDSPIPVGAFTRSLSEAVQYVDELMHKDSFESLKSGLKDIKLKLEEMTRLLSGDAGSNDTVKLQTEKICINESLKALEKNIAELRSHEREDQSVREDIMVDLREWERKLRTAERELEVVRERMREVEFHEASYRSRLDDWKVFVRDNKTSVPETSEVEAFRDDVERHNLLRAIERLRIKLEEAGGIDSSVLKEYDDTKERDTFLASELADIEKAHKTLEQLMQELEEKLEEQFSDGLKKINTEFQLLFKKVFGGGKAQLIYIEPSMNEDGEEIKGGVDIAIDIPRKRLRNLDMLSGGERALTSVALLFAMSTVNPPPFLVLDETDAALDEANSQRYGDLLAELARKTQLVVITHNRQTMSRAGVLYGVTMGGDGVSKILSLKFEEAKELAESAG